MLTQWLSALSVLPPAAYERLLDKIEEAVLVVDRSGRVLDTNPAAELLLRRFCPNPPATFVGSALEDTLGPLPWLNPPRPPAPRPILTPWTGPGLAPTRWQGAPPPRPPRARTTEADHPLTDVRGSGIDLRVHASPLYDGDDRQLGLALVIHDVTDANRQRAELDRANSRLQEQAHTIDLLRTDLAEQAIHDHLTGLYNRRHLLCELAAAVQYATAAKSELSVAVLDIDHFRELNDRYGTVVGDGVLVQIATMISGAVLPGELVARHGGQEFALLLPGVGMAQASRYVDALRLLIGGGELLVEGQPVHATFSAGVAGFTGHQSPTELLCAADQALRYAKRHGRDRVHQAPEPARTVPARAG